ncbi:hypothetical protein [Fowl aviadenovirus C]|uniref:9.1 kDa protein n=4 Tax=Fowl aviadenovirus C TaxID=190063 RepID=H8WQW5_9ADEN|nr:hypothetical protein QKD79_gp26 [Fowl aviadenovirus C]ANG08828.1 hypothetical protein [Fowl aviadenovirus 4]QJZ28079.1 hypothetical protein [Fowl aviadenovirus 10]UVW56785.1 hypothetical protein [Fowl adenovirus]AIS19799.1 hypothetical protein [Fowl aviadenovirus C]AMB36776.1 hypothetical protein [Fowl aviadenovirus C]
MLSRVRLRTETRRSGFFRAYCSILSRISRTSARRSAMCWGIGFSRIEEVAEAGFLGLGGAAGFRLALRALAAVGESRVVGHS